MVASHRRISVPIFTRSAVPLGRLPDVAGRGTPFHGLSPRAEARIRRLYRDHVMEILLG